MNFSNLFFSLRHVLAAADDVLTSVSGADVSASDVAGSSCAAYFAEGGWKIWAIYGVLLVVLYFVMFRPQKKRREQEEKMRKDIEVGDEITTIGGICGRVVSVKEDDTIVVEVGSDRLKLKMKSWSISVNETAKARKAAEEAANPPKKGLAGLFGKKDQ